MKKIRKIIQIDENKCNGCGQCILSCAEGALEIIDGKARVVSDNLCDGLGACIGECPEDALHIVEKDAEAFDEAAVERHLELKHKKVAVSVKPLGCGCPSQQMESFPSVTLKSSGTAEVDREGSELTHWPVQIRLVPPHAPFLQNKDLVVAADCVPVAFANFHAAFLKGNSVMVGCPKFDDTGLYVEKFTEIFKTAKINKITVVIMEVPCCSGLPMIVKTGLEQSGKKIPLTIAVISTKGGLLREQVIFS